MPRALAALLCSALLLTACADGDASSTSASATPSQAPTGEDAVAALEASAAGGWAEGGQGFGPVPPLPPGASAEVLEDLDRYGRKWLGLGLLDPRTWSGDVDEWLGAVDYADQIGYRTDLAGPDAIAYVTVLQPGWEVLATRARGAFSASAVDLEGEPGVRLTWRGTVLHAVESDDGDGALLPLWRQVHWDLAGFGAPAVEARVRGSNVDVCVTRSTGRLAPTAGDLSVDEEYFAAQDMPEPTAEQQAEEKARLDACAGPSTGPSAEPTAEPTGSDSADT